MSLDGTLLARAKTRLEERRSKNEAMYDAREREVFTKNPRVRLLDEALRSTVMDVIGLALKSGEDPTDAIDAIRNDNLLLQEERRAEIVAAGFPADYLDRSPVCRKCGDTGYVGISPCSCLMELYKTELTKSLSNLYKLGDESFDSFSLSWYDDNPDIKTGLSPRDCMEIIYETCLNYALTFSRQKTNLLMTGGPGLGKTFLSACIARVVSESGFSVVYDTAGTIFSRFETARFLASMPERAEDVSEARAEKRRYYECDLLIMDDLGTELTNSFTVSSLYDLVNSRLISGKKIIISTNLTPDAIQERYSPPLASRLLGEFRLLSFCGTDIRILKNRL